MMVHSTRRIRWSVWTVVACLLGLVGLETVNEIWSGRTSDLITADEQAIRFLAGAEVALNRSLLSIDVSLAGTDELLSLSTNVVSWINPESASQWMRGAARQNLLVRFVALVDANSKVIASSHPLAANLELTLPEGFIANTLEPSFSMFVLSAPTISPVTSERVIYAGRALRLADGARLVAVAEVPSDLLAAVMLQGIDTAMMEVTLERANGELLLGAPNQESVSQGKRLQPPLNALEVSGIDVFQPARLTNVPALVRIRPLLSQNLWISASIPVDIALKGWKSDRTTFAFTASAFSILLVLGGWFTVVYLERMAKAHRELAESKGTLDRALETMVSGFLLLDNEARVVQWNRRFEEMYPHLQGHLVANMPFRELMALSARLQLPHLSEDERATWVNQRLELQQTQEAPHEQVLPTGQHIQITERATPEGGVVITYHDVTDMRLATEEISQLAFYDTLTGLPNRRLLLNRLAMATAGVVRSGHFGALLFIDLDSFKVVNDTLGHAVGDGLLQQVAERLKMCIREEDTVARHGGDEFVVMLPNLATDAQHAAVAARLVGEKILSALNHPYLVGGHSLHSVCSLGAALFGGEAVDAGALLRQADIAMYQAKAKSGNTLCFFDPQMQAVISARAALEADLRLALTRGEFVLHYQAQFTGNFTMVGVEVLLRWHHPSRGLVLPGEFISVAEDSSLIVPIGDWVLRAACEQLMRWQSDGDMGQVPMSVNVSARQFRQADFVDKVSELVQSLRIPAGLLTLELTESVMLESVESCIAIMDRLKALGVHFAVDDFGTGYSSLAYLTRLPLDQLKIDQSFVHQLGVRTSDGTIVQTIIAMARSLGLEVIAEGVESGVQRDILDAYGCKLFQGFYFERPTSASELEAMQHNTMSG